MITTAQVLTQFEKILANVDAEQVAHLAAELAKIVPESSESVIEWQKRLHYQEDDTILAGAYLRVFPAKQYIGEANIYDILACFIAPNPPKFWGEMSEVFETLLTDIVLPLTLNIGVALYIAEGMGATMFSFTAPAKKEALNKFEKRYLKIKRELEEMQA
jgi:hypothetical protein